ncbi:phosphoribosylformylglycinamidine synthase subunit PurQ [Periweissella ghanensis]|uniref:Phosphoribosylformylglycinamidine synthase subunit PurQ n=1 Tax=Periweissella ghanensis TaxID=467997 RepID=A0ABN8BRS6_9LACO|nr:phosphoribosylformylglycinamidine synthase subunit PurQ [Periweissella ghanensis]MCM0600020.1 phosphoribosylformylglycinamidine synthase subunit PurQ [Periweissella ghanensis]CAH0418924.1 Phosphoribosylformylglycinamidine synthase subunit PurQ [Periweissella ghanensis]
MKAAVITFPGSNCDLDMYHALVDEFEIETEILPATVTDLSAYDAIFIPGGFSYGDYLRTGAIARFAPVMAAIKAADQQGKIIVGICNGFQILTEAGLLPGALQTNTQPGFICDVTGLKVVNTTSKFTNAFTKSINQFPIAHGEGNYYVDAATLATMQANQQILFTYTDNPNGSIADIAGVTNTNGNVFGMMPHPERAVDALLGNVDGRAFFSSIIASLVNQQEAIKA